MKENTNESLEDRSALSVAAVAALLGAGKTAKAVAERASSGNAYYWGFNS